MKMVKSNKITTTPRCNKSERSLESSTTTKRLTMESILLSIGQWSSWRIMPGMKASGSLERILGKAKEDRFGLMVPCTKAGGKITRPMERVGLFTPTETSMTASGSMTRHMALVSIAIWMAPSTRDIGKKISSMETVLRPGQMVPSTRVNTYKARRMAREDSLGLMDQLTTEFSTRTTFKAMESIIGLMAESIMDFG